MTDATTPSTNLSDKLREFHEQAKLERAAGFPLRGIEHAPMGVLLEAAERSVEDVPRGEDGYPTAVEAAAQLSSLMTDASLLHAAVIGHLGHEDYLEDADELESSLALLLIRVFELAAMYEIQLPHAVENALRERWEEAQRAEEHEPRHAIRGAIPGPVYIDKELPEVAAEEVTHPWSQVGSDPLADLQAAQRAARADLDRHPGRES